MIAVHQNADVKIQSNHQVDDMKDEIAQENIEEMFLNDIWCLYFHDPHDSDWTFKSYKLIGTLSSVESFWITHELLHDKWCHGMFFLMREHVFPCWDDVNNKDGGCLSMKLTKTELNTFWQHLSIRLLGECLSPDANIMENINGISISPKKHSCIIKIWLKTNDFTNPSMFDIPVDYSGECLYKTNM